MIRATSGALQREREPAAEYMEDRIVQGFRLPDVTRVRQVRLQVSDLANAIIFYRGLLGFREIYRNEATVALSATGQPPSQIVLVERAGARPKPPGTTGLYHVAIRYPTRHALARAFRRLLAHDWPFQGAADHLVSEALYLADPDGNGLELYVDRPRDQWPERDGKIAMATDPLDVESLLATAGEDSPAWPGLHPGTEIGHVHLQVSDLSRAEAFYHDLLGLDVTQRSYPGTLFLSAGGYHHHLAVNVWAGIGAPTPPRDAVGLRSFALALADGDAWHSLLERIRGAGVEVEERSDNGRARAAQVRDPDGIGVELILEKQK